LRIGHIGAKANRLVPLGFCAGFVVLLVKGDAKLVVSHAIVGIVPQRTLEGINSSIGVTLTKLYLPAIDQTLYIVRIGLQNFIVQLGSFVETVFQDQELDVVLLNLYVL